MELRADRSKQVAYTYPGYPIYIERGSFSRFPDGVVADHWHDDLEFVAVLEGGMEFWVDGRSASLRAGQGIVVNAGRLHRCVPLPDEVDCDMASILVHPDLLAGSPVLRHDFIDPFIGAEAPSCVPLAPQEPWERAALDDIRALLDERDAAAGPLRALARFAHLMALLVEHQHVTTGGSSRRADQVATMKRMMSFIEAAHTERVTLAQIASAGAVGQSTCCKLFSTFVGCSPIAYLNRYRLRRAAELLLETDDPITEVAFATGFSGASYFAESFRAWLGMSPTAYRRLRRSGA